MTEQQTPVLTPETSPTSAPSPTAPPKKKRKKKHLKGIITLVILLAILAGGGYLLWRFVLQPPPVEQGEIYAVPASIGTIQSVVQGSGNAKAKESAAITLTEGGTVREVFVNPGDVVTAGQPLYTIYSEAAEKAVSDAQEKVSNLNRELSKLQEQVSDLVVKAPFAGKLMNVQTFTPDQDVSSGAEVTTLVNDKKLKLSLYFSYAYENSIAVGQSVSVNIPAVMKDFSGKVEKINKVSYISPEGAVHFEVVVVFDNPGTLTAGMDASVAIALADGTSAYPYASGKTEYYETRTITTKASGPVVSSNLLNYAGIRDLDYDTVEVGGEVLPQCFSGSGAQGLPGDWSAPSRFIRLAMLRKYAVRGRTERQGIARLFRIMESAAFPLGMVRVSQPGGPTELDENIQPWDYTLYTAVACAETGRYSWITYDNPTIRTVTLAELAHQTSPMQLPLQEKTELFSVLSSDK